MKIPVAEEDDSGVYTCMASNPTGQDTTSTNVSIAGMFVWQRMYCVLYEGIERSVKCVINVLTGMSKVKTGVSSIFVIVLLYFKKVMT